MSPSMRDAADDTRPPDTRPPDTRHPGAPAAGRAERFRGAPAPGPHVLLIQPQAENAGAQAIARMLATALAERGYRTGQLFFYRKTGAFDAPLLVQRPFSMPRPRLQRTGVWRCSRLVTGCGLT